MFTVMQTPRALWRTLLGRTWPPSRSIAARFLWFIALPLGALALGMRAVAMFRHPLHLGLQTWTVALIGDLLAWLALTLIALAALRSCRTPSRRTFIFATLQVIAIFAATFHLGALYFYMVTGSFLDYSLVRFSLSQPWHILPIITSELNSPWVTIGALALVFMAIAPWVVSLREARRHPDQPIDVIPRSSALIYFTAAIACWAACVALPILARDVTATRTPLANILLTALRNTDHRVLASSPSESPQAKIMNLGTIRAKTNKQPQNIVVIILESVGANAVTIYEPGLKTTPYLASLASNSLTAERAYAVVPHTSKALVTILCGIEPYLFRDIAEAIPNGIPTTCLAGLLRSGGYQTAFFQAVKSGFEHREQLVRNMGFQQFFPLSSFDLEGFEKANYFGYEDDVMIEPSRAWIREQRRENRPFLLTYLTVTPHHQYLAPRRYGRHAFAGNETYNRYLNCVRYVDSFVKNVIETFKQENLYENTIFVVIGDHGEAFGEHGMWQHNDIPFDEVLRVPFLIHHAPRFRGGRRIHSSVSQLDLLPTVLDFAGFRLENNGYPGRHLLTLTRSRSVEAHCWYEQGCAVLVQNHQKFIHYYGRRSDQLFNLSIDPKERFNFAATASPRQQRWVGKAKDRLISWRQHVVSRYQGHSQRELLANFVTKTEPAVDKRVTASIGDFAEIVGFRVDPNRPLRSKEFADVSVVYRTKKSIPAGWRLFVHAVDDTDRLQKNLDHVPVAGLYPLQHWKPGEYVVDRFQVEVPGEISGSELALYLGFWHPHLGRATIAGDIPHDGKNRAKVVRLELVQ